MEYDVTIVGGGLAGLCCAHRVQEAGLSFVLLEGADRLGGRVASDRVEGFTLDRGFQILLEAYPTAQEFLDYSKLRLKRFDSGAIVYNGNKRLKVSDPTKHPSDLLANVFYSPMTFGDKLKLLSLRRYVSGRSGEALLQDTDISTELFLEEQGFSEASIRQFFRPFLSGIFLEQQLQTSARMFLYVFKMFSEGRVAVPEGGMAAIPQALAEGLPSESIHLNSTVEEVGSNYVELASGECIESRAVVLATELDGAQALGLKTPERAWNMTTCLYFDAGKAPLDRPILMLNGSGKGLINSLHVVSAVNPAAAPSGRALISVSVLADEERLEDRVRTELQALFGDAVKTWRLLKSYRIPRALPSQLPGELEPFERPVCSESGVFACGDHLDQSSIQGAMRSGVRAADAVVLDLSLDSPA